MTSHIYGFDHSTHNWEAVRLDSSGKLEVAANFNTAGLATDTLQTAGNASMASLDTKVTVCDTANIAGSVGVTGTVVVDGSGVTQPVSGTFFQATQPVSAAALPLPSGAASETTLASLDGKVTACDTGNIAGSVGVTGTVVVDGSGVTQPVSGTFFQATQPVSATALPLPTGAATESSLSTIAGCENGAQALQVDIQADATGIASQSLQTAGNASLTALENCVDSGVNQVNVYLRNEDIGLATSTQQTSLETKVGELNDNAFVKESVVVAAGAMDNTITQFNCTNYAKVEVVMKGTVAMNSTQCMLQWSDDNSTWYSPQFYQTLYEVYDADGTTSVGEQGHLISDVLAKYLRVRLYNPGASSDTVVCLIARIH